MSRAEELLDDDPENRGPAVLAEALFTGDESSLEFFRGHQQESYNVAALRNKGLSVLDYE